MFTKTEMSLNDVKLMKFYECQHRGMLSLKRTNIFDIENEVTNNRKVTRIPASYYSGQILEYHIYKSIFLQLFSNLFKEKKINYNKLKAIALVVTEKSINKNKELASKLAIKQDNYDLLKEKIFSNLENILNLFLDSDLENSMNHCFTQNFKMYDYLYKRIKSIKNKNIINYSLPKIDMENLKETNFKINYEILSINKAGDNLVDLVLTCPFDTDESIKRRNIWLAMLVNYFNDYKNQKKYSDYFLDGWFVINKLIVYNPLTMKRHVYYPKDFDTAFQEVELMKIIFILQNKVQIKNFYHGKCEYCEARGACSTTTYSKGGKSLLLNNKNYNEVTIKI